MHKRICIVGLVLVSIICLVSCAGKKDNLEPAAPEHKYSDILDALTDYIENGIETGITSYNESDEVDRINYRDGFMEIFRYEGALDDYAYVITDINGDGTDELLFGDKVDFYDSQRNIVSLDYQTLYTLKDGKPVMLSGDDFTFCTPLKDGCVLKTSFTNESYYFSKYEITPDAALKLIEGYKTLEMIDEYNHSEDCYHIEADGTESLTDFSFDDFLKKWDEFMALKAETSPETLSHYKENSYNGD